MSYRETSLWNNENELRCLIIFKKLETENFPRGKQMEYCREMSKITGLEPGNISAKVSNYKSVAGINNNSNSSVNTVDFYCKYTHLSIQEIQKIIDNL
ncbi:hypothetical protein [Geothermobacter hydrogeniphilus]|uniref:hypothetical protein n=1 Tax=Geothermobacter hydrogeniphilus TaxID=1969733 RepID=UPI0011AF54ED|nr:hypothetical protein [Geothermobacter hydrogeniphilus]